MKLLVALLLGIFVFGLINNASLLNVVFLLFAVYLVFNILQNAKSNSNKLKDFVDFKDISLDVKVKDGSLDKMLKDAGQVTKKFAKGEEKDIKKAITKGTHKTLTDASSIFKK